MASWVRVIGDEQVVEALDKLGADVEKKLERITNAAAKPVHELIQEGAPRRTGQLSSTIAEEVVERRPGRVVQGLGPDRKAFYGFFQEFGTAHHAAQPFLLPALKKGEPRAIEAATLEIRKIIS